MAIGAREIYFDAIESGEVDLVPEYTNSLLSFVLRRDDPDALPEATNVEEQVTELAAPGDEDVLRVRGAEQPPAVAGHDPGAVGCVDPDPGGVEALKDFLDNGELARCIDREAHFRSGHGPGHAVEQGT